MKIPLKYNRFLLFIVLLFIVKSAQSQENIQEFIREVQINSQKSYDRIRSVSFHGKSKYYIYVGWNTLGFNFVPMSEEYLFDGFWMKPDSLRIQVRALRKATPDTGQTLRKIERDVPLPNPFQFSFNTSVLGMEDDSIRTGEGERIQVWPIYPFAKGADSVYAYEFGSEIKFGDQTSGFRTIKEVIVTPKHKDIPAVSGIFQIDADLKEVVGSDVVFNEAAQLSMQDQDEGIPIPIDVSEDHRTKTKKVLYSSVYWLPETMEEEFYVQVWGIKVKLHRILEFYRYTVNPEPPDTTVIPDKVLSYNRDPELEEELFQGLEHPHRLTKEEEELIIREIEKIASSIDLNSELFDMEAIAQDAMKMRLGHKSSRYFQIAQRMSDFLHYNRVEGLRLNYELTFSNLLLDKLILGIKGGYGFKDQRFKGEAAGLYFLDKKKKFFIEGNLFNTITFAEDRQLFSGGKNTFSSFFFNTDYRDYYYKEGGNIGIGYLVTNNLAVKLYGVNQKETGASNHTHFSVFHPYKPFRYNPEIIEGNFTGLRTVLLYKTGSFNAQLRTEYTDIKNLSSNFSYKLAEAHVKWNNKIDHLNNLYFSFSGGISDGNLPPQRWFDFGGKSLFNYKANLRGVGYKEFTGDRMVYGIIEYTRFWMHMFEFKREPSKLDGLRRTLKFTFWTGLGWSKLSERNRIYAANVRTPMIPTGGLYHEIGIGIGDRFNFMRLDLIRNSIDKNKIVVSINFFK